MNNAMILQIEDDPNDVFLFQHAVKRAGLPIRLQAARNASEAIEYLTRSCDINNPEDCQTPALILLDLKLPGTGGLQILEWIRAQPRLRLIPVVVMSSSTQPEDIREAYLRGANSFLVKPSSSTKLVEFVKLLQAYWFSANQPGIES